MVAYLNSVIALLKKNLIYIVICVIFFILGIVLAMVLNSKEQTSFFYDNILERYVFIYSKNSEQGSYFLSKIFSCLIYAAIIALCGFTVYVLPIHFVIFIYQGFIIGSILPCFFDIFSLTGAMIFFVAIVPSMVIRFLSCVVFSVIFLDFSLKCKRCKNIKYSALILNFLLLFTLHVIAVLWEAFFICLIIKPFNLYF